MYGAPGKKMHGTTIRIAKLHIVDDSNDLGQSASIQILELKSTSAVTEAIPSPDLKQNIFL
jgi:hypothetical protein